MTDSPLVSIIMPLYNAEPYLVETFDSVLSQSYKNWELIVVEDCSSDASLRLAKEYENKDRRISVHPNEHNVGAAKSRNTGIEHVSGDFVAFMDADDAWLPDKLDHQLAYMRDCGLGMCFTSYETIESDGQHRNYVHVPKSIDYDGFLKNTVTCSHTIAFDLSKIPLSLLVCPDFGDSFDFPEDMVSGSRSSRVAFQPAASTRCLQRTGNMAAPAPLINSVQFPARGTPTEKWRR